ALARDEFNATHRPRIRVRHVTLDRLYDKDSIPFEAGQPIYGRFDIVNVGAVEARVMGWRAFLLIGQEGNPPPWPTLVDPDPESDEFESLRPILSPGVYAELRVKSRHPSSATAASDLI